jgi:Tfp pilus assembly protein PilF
VGQTLNNLARVYRDQGKYGEAERLFKPALTIREQTLGPSHPDVAATRHDLAAVASEQGRYEEKTKGATSPAVAQALHNQALASWRQGKYSEAEGLYKRALAIREQALGSNHSTVGQTLNNLALVYQDQGKYGEAKGCTSAHWRSGSRH